jgi:DNA repair protein RadC
MSDAPEDADTRTVTAPEIREAPTETLLDLVLGRPGVAAHVLVSLGGLPPLARFTPAALTERFGITLDEATRVAAALELGRRRFVEAAHITTIRSSHDVATWAHPRIGLLTHEEMWLLALDGQNGLRGARMISRGGLHGVALRTSDILRAALELAASGFVLVHNHPSGNPTPSKEDLEHTAHVRLAADITGLTFVDHVIIMASGRFSAYIANQWQLPQVQ